MRFLQLCRPTLIGPAIVAGWSLHPAFERANDRRAARKRRRSRYRREADRPAPGRLVRRAAAAMDPALPFQLRPGACLLSNLKIARFDSERLRYAGAVETGFREAVVAALRDSSTA